MRRDRGEASFSARYAVLESSSSPVAWVELVEASCDVPCSVLLDLLGKFVLVVCFFASVGLSASTGLDSGYLRVPVPMRIAPVCRFHFPFISHKWDL